MRATTATLAPALLVLVAGCKDVKKGTEAESGLPSLGSEPPVVRLLDPGAEPRRVLAYAPSGMARTERLEWQVMLDAAAADDASMALAMSLDWRPPADRTGPWRFAVKRAETGVPGNPGLGERMTIGQIDAMFADVQGRVIAHRPDHFEFHQTAGPPTKPSLLGLLHALVVPLPTEAVGIGARWEVVQTGSDEGVSTENTRRYQIVGLAHRTVALRVSGTAAWKQAAGAGLDAGPPLLTEAIEGTETLNLTDILPGSADLTFVYTTTVSFPASREESSSGARADREMETKIRLKVGGGTAGDRRFP
jgi:hypothetical protein